MTAEIAVGIVTVSDRAFHGVYPDESGPAIEAWFKNNMPTARITSRVIVPDDLDAIQTAVKSATDGVSPPDMLLTTGGTGFTERDVTPEAVGPLLHRHAPGLVVAIMTESMKITPLAMLSRPVAGTRNKTLVVTLPGKPKACKENLDILRVALPHLFNLMRAKPDLHHKTGCQCGHNHGDGKNHNDESLSLPIDDVVNRPRQSPFSMLSVAEASTIVSRFATRLQTDHINVDSDDLVGRVLAEAVYARHNVPNTRVSLVDGYAVLASDGAGLFQVTDSVVAGSDSALPMLLPGHAARVTTGAPIPANATAVVMVEDTELVETTANNQEERTVKILRAIQQHANIRDAGSDIRQGQLVLPAGTVISSQNAHLGIILSSGNTMVPLFLSNNDCLDVLL
jgi:gephyrin